MHDRKEMSEFQDKIFMNENSYNIKIITTLNNRNKLSQYMDHHKPQRPTNNKDAQ